MDLETLRRAYREIQRTSPLSEDSSTLIVRHIDTLNIITRDQLGKSGGTEVRSNRRDRFCDGQKCPLVEALGKLSKVDFRKDSREIRNICRHTGLKSANSSYGEDLPTTLQSVARKFVFTADCTKHAGDRTYPNYTNCGSLMVTDLSFRNLPKDKKPEDIMAVQTIRAQWVLNNSDITNPPRT